MLGAILASAGPVATSLFGLIDELFTSDEERLAAKHKIIELEHQGRLAQLNVNTVEAAHRSVFVAGWRPFIGWVCGVAFLWAYIIQPSAAFFVVVSGLEVPLELLPVIDIAGMLPVLLGMLGLAANRSYEKVKRVAAESMNEINRNRKER